MNNEQAKEVIESLVGFVKRVSTDKNATQAEIAALPEIAKTLFESAGYGC